MAPRHPGASPRLLWQRDVASARETRAPRSARFRCRRTGAAHAADSIAFRIFFKSAMKRAISSRRLSSVGARRIDDGCTVAVTNGARSDFTNVPRWMLTLNFGPNSACAAVDPRQMITRGLTTLISASSHGRQALISIAVGFL